MDQATMERSDTFCLCPRFSHTFSILGKKWNGLIIEVLLHEESQRFKDLASSIDRCSDRVLCERLKELEQEGIVSRNTYPLTEQGKDLAPVMAAVHNWSDKWC